MSVPSTSPHGLVGSVPWCAGALAVKRLSTLIATRWAHPAGAVISLTRGHCAQARARVSCANSSATSRSPQYGASVPTSRGYWAWQNCVSSGTARTRPTLIAAVMLGQRFRQLPAYGGKQNSRNPGGGPWLALWPSSFLLWRRRPSPVTIPYAAFAVAVSRIA